MSGIFSKPKTPKPIETPRAPQRDDALIAIQDADRVGKRRGRAANILAGGDSGTATNLLSGGA